METVVTYKGAKDITTMKVQYIAGYKPVTDVKKECARGLRESMAPVVGLL